MDGGGARLENMMSGEVLRDHGLRLRNTMVAVRQEKGDKA